MRLEGLDMELKARDPAEGMPDGGRYALFLCDDGRIRYGFWSEQFGKFFAIGERVEPERVVCWWEVPWRAEQLKGQSLTIQHINHD